MRTVKQDIDLFMLNEYMNERKALVTTLANHGSLITRHISNALWFRLNFVSARLKELYHATR
jgi:hypothetical protein